MVDGSGRPVSDVHPALKASVASIKIGATILYILGLGLLAGGGVAAWYLQLWFLAPAAAPLFGLAWYLKRFELPFYLSASRILQTRKPIPMAMASIGYGDLKGMYAALWTPGRDRPNRPWGVAAFKTSKTHTLPRDEIKIDLYLEDDSPESLVIAQFDQRFYFGRLTTPESRLVAWKKFRCFYFALTALLLLVFSGVAFAQYFNFQSKAEQLQLSGAGTAWPKAKGVIKSSRVEQIRANKGKYLFEANVAYEYSVRGSSFHGDRVNFCYSPLSSRGVAERIVARYPAGSSVNIAHDPQNPGVSVLETGGAEQCRDDMDSIKGVILAAGIGSLMGLLIMIALWMWLVARKRKGMREIME